MRYKIGQTFTRNIDDVRGVVAWQNPTTRTVYLRIGTHQQAYTPEALHTYWSLSRDVCDLCREAVPVEQITSVPARGGGWMDLCPDCYAEGPGENPRAAATPREV